MVQYGVVCMMNNDVSCLVIEPKCLHTSRTCIVNLVPDAS